MHTPQEYARRVKLLILDVDGVMTDGRIYYNAQGEESKSFYVQDGLGLKLLQSTGVKLAIISGRADACVEHRARALGFDYYFAGVSNKQLALNELMVQSGLSPDDCAFVGDDIIDLPVLRRVAFPVVVPAAPDRVQQYARYITGASGGQGAVREVCELIMQAQGTFDTAIAKYLL